MVNNYLLFLKTYLNNLSKIFKKEVIVCLHPSSNFKVYKKTLNKLIFRNRYIKIKINFNVNNFILKGIVT